MPDPAFLVDGVMEQRIINHLCHGKIIQRLNCNGTDTSIDVIVNRIEFHIRMLNNRYSPIIVLIDREKRAASCDEISAEIARQLDIRGYAGQYVIGVVDRCIENWILADWNNVAKRLGERGLKPIPDCTQYEGKQGKTELKRLLPRELLYNEPTWGKAMFLCCRPNNIYNNSASFRAFIDKLNMRCHWLADVNERFRIVYE